MPTVRPARPTDTPAIRTVASRSWRATYADSLADETIDRALAEWYDSETIRESIRADDVIYRVALDQSALDHQSAPDDQSAHDDQSAPDDQSAHDDQSAPGDQSAHDDQSADESAESAASGETAGSPPAGVVGYVSGRPLDTEGVASLDAIYVLPSRWNDGIGSTLLRAFESAASERGCDRLQLRVVASNDAVGFYRRYGYEVTERTDTELFGEQIQQLRMAGPIGRDSG